MLRELVSSATSGVDRVVAATMIRRHLRAASGPAIRADEEWPNLPAIMASYDRPEHYADARVFFGDPSPARPILARVKKLADGDVLDAVWPSGEPFHRGVAAAYLAHPSNRSAGARLFLHRERPGAAVILVHGYLGGRYAVEERIWNARRLYDRGFDVALATLPFHGVRADARPPLFPAADPRMTNEGIRQTIGDLRALMGFFHERGTTRVGAMGMSLGGYAVALLATVEPTLAFAVPVVPLADLTDFARGHLPAQVDAFGLARARAHRVISPLARRPVIAPSSVLVIGASADEIAPIAHAEALAAHFGAQLETIHGGHVLQLGRAAAFRKIDQFLSTRWSDA